MIKVIVQKENEKIKEIKIKGHANFDDFGKDIVCAAVSSIVTTTVNAVEKLEENSLKVSEKNFSIEVLKSTDTVNKLLENMISLLKELEQEYPKNIRFL